ncbi:ATP-binding protein [Comamonas sp. C24C]
MTLLPHLPSLMRLKLGLSFKLFLAILAACILVLVVNSVFVRISFVRDFMGYLNEQGVERMHEVVPRLSAAYESHGSWEFARQNPEKWFALMRPPSMEQAPLKIVPPVSDQTGAILRFALLDIDGGIVIGNANAAAADAIRLPINLRQGQQVGWLAMVPFQNAIAAGDVRFYEAQLRARWLNGAASVVVAALLAWLLTGTLLRRLKVIAQFVHGLAIGDYSKRIPVRDRDELDQLASDISQLAGKLENIEHNRRAFMADISHELRTPLAVLQAELEAIQDGIRPMSLSTLMPLQSEVTQLNKLVDDLHELAVTQTGEFRYTFEALDLDRIVAHCTMTMQARARDCGLSMAYSSKGQPVFIQGDESRLQQLLSNLLENSIRYTQRGGQILLTLTTQAGEAELSIEDSPPGVDEPSRQQLFERFYRVDASRNRSSGGSGLGLSICRNIVEFHGGEIAALPSRLGGLCIMIRLPALPPP